METAALTKELPPEPVVAAAESAHEAGDAEHFVVCLECGQGFDRRNLAHALYHQEPGHDPFFVES